MDVETCACGGAQSLATSEEVERNPDSGPMVRQFLAAGAQFLRCQQCGKYSLRVRGNVS